MTTVTGIHADRFRADLVASLNRDFLMRVSLADLTFTRERPDTTPDMFTFTLNNRNRVSSAVALLTAGYSENYVLSVACTLHDKMLEQL